MKIKCWIKIEKEESRKRNRQMNSSLWWALLCAHSHTFVICYLCVTKLRDTLMWWYMYNVLVVSPWNRSIYFLAFLVGCELPPAFISTCLSLSANRSVHSVSLKFTLSGLMLTKKRVRANTPVPPFFPKESASKYVSCELRKGTWAALLAIAPMQVTSELKLLLIAWVSFNSCALLLALLASSRCTRRIKRHKWRKR